MEVGLTFPKVRGRALAALVFPIRMNVRYSTIYLLVLQRLLCPVVVRIALPLGLTVARPLPIGTWFIFSDHLLVVLQQLVSLVLGPVLGHVVRWIVVPRLLPTLHSSSIGSLQVDVGCHHSLGNVL